MFFPRTWSLPLAWPSRLSGGGPLLPVLSVVRHTALLTIPGPGTGTGSPRVLGRNEPPPADTFRSQAGRRPPGGDEGPGLWASRLLTNTESPAGKARPSPGAFAPNPGRLPESLPHVLCRGCCSEPHTPGPPTAEKPSGLRRLRPLACSGRFRGPCRCGAGGAFWVWLLPRSGLWWRFVPGVRAEFPFFVVFWLKDIALHRQAVGVSALPLGTRAAPGLWPLHIELLEERYV